MIVEMGNATAHQCDMVDGNHVGHARLEHGEPVVYAWTDHGALTHEPTAASGTEAGIHVLSNDITQLPDHECFVSVVSDWPHHSASPPTWLVVTAQGETAEAADDLARMLSEFYGCPIGRPDDLEDTHHTFHGPPGVGPAEEG